MSNRPSGVLTETDREFLQSDGAYYQGDNARQSRYQRRRDIRGRIVQSLLDFREIEDFLDESERQKIFNEPTKNGAENEFQFRIAIDSLLYWIYLGYRESGIDFSEKAKEPIKRAEEDFRQLQSGDLVNVEVGFDVEVVDQLGAVEEYARKLEEGEPIRANIIYRIPTLPDFDANAEQIDTIWVISRRGQEDHEAERRIIKTILREHVGIDPNVEFVQSRQAEVELEPDDFKDEDLPDNDPR